MSEQQSKSSMTATLTLRQRGVEVLVSGPPDEIGEVFDRLCEEYEGTPGYLVSTKGVKTEVRLSARDRRREAAIKAGRELKKTGWKKGPRGRRMKDDIELATPNELMAMEDPDVAAYHEAWRCASTGKLLMLEPGDLGWEATT